MFPTFSRLEHPVDDYTSDLLRIHVADPSALSVAEITGILFGFSFDGHETMTKAICSALRHLVTHRERWDAICANPSLIPRALEEVLRLDGSVVSACRYTKVPVTIGGVNIP